MTDQELRKRIGKAARELAMECLNGTATEMATRHMYSRALERDGLPCRCAMGLVLHRAGDDSFTLLTRLATRGSVYDANDDANDHADRQERLVFPLLALADECEATP